MKHLNEESISKIIKLIELWDDTKISWPALCDSVEINIGTRYTRQCLSKYKLICDAFNIRKINLKENAGVDPVYKTKQMQDAVLKIQRLEQKIERLEKQNNDLLVQFNRWLYNATHSTRHPMSVEDLNKALTNNQRS